MVWFSEHAERVENKIGGPKEDLFLLLTNAHYEPIEFTLPAPHRWETAVDTARELDALNPAESQQHRYITDGRSLALLRRACE